MSEHTYQRPMLRSLPAIRAARRQLSSRPALYLPIRRLGRPNATVTRSTQLVIEGFPRSGNSFTELAIRASQPSLERLAHHSHSAAQVKRAVEWGIPTLLVIREPAEAIASLAAHQRGTRLVQSLVKDYVHFHVSILGSLPGIVTVTFDEVTGDFNTVVDRLNARFGLGLRPVDDLDDLRRSALRLMDERSKARQRGEIGGANPDRPRAAETPIKTTARAALSSESISEWLCHANLLYRGLADLAQSPDSKH